MLPRGALKLTAGLVFLLGLVVCSNLFAGTTGKIAGRVVDSETGKPLAGANVLIEGTAMGAAADLDGYYYTINVPVGTYSVTARMMGYEPVTTDGVKAIMDLTTTVNFALKPTVIEVPGVVVVATRPMVVPDATSTLHYITTQEIESQPIQQVSEAVQQQAGAVYSTGGQSGLTGGIHIRGGRSDEVLYMVDGMSIQDPVMGGAGAEINLNAVNEVVVQTGGFNAEYGQAMSGVVNLVTKEGAETFSGMLRYRTDPFGGSLDQGSHRYEANLGGPFPLLEDLRYFISSEASVRGHVVAANVPYRKEPDADGASAELVTGEPGPINNTDREYYSTQGKLTYKLTPAMKFTVGGFLSREQYGQYAEHAGLPGTGQWDENGSKYKPPDEMLSVLEKASQVNAVWTHAIGPSTFYTITGAWFDTHLWQGIRDTLGERDRAFWEDLEFVPWWRYNIIEARAPEQRNPGWNNHDFYGKDAAGNYYYPWGVPGSTLWGFAFGHMGYWRERESRYYNARFDLTSQVTKDHQIKFGAETRINESVYDLAQYIYTRPDTSDTTIPSNLYYDEYEVHPREASAYIQDKIEYSGFVANVGLRFDYFDAVDSMFINPITRAQGLAKPEAKYKLSPRLGVSYPVSERTALRVSYGRFFQIPLLQWVYTNIDRPVNELRAGWPLIGNPNIDAQTVTQYEIGLAHQFAPTLALDVTAFYKDMYDVLTCRYVPDPAFGYTMFEAADYGNVKGIEFVLRKRAERYLTGQLAYTLSEAKGTGSYSREAYYDYIANMPVDPYTGLPLVLPQVDYWLEFDQRHTFAGNMNFNLPDGSGPTIGQVKPLHNLNVNVLASLGSGMPYTPRDLSNNMIGVINSKRKPWTWTTDLKVSKDFRLAGLTWSLFGEVTNLFNRLNIVNVYPTTGLPDDDGKMSSYAAYMADTWTPGWGASIDSTSTGFDERRDLDRDGQITRDEWYQSYVNAYKDWITDPFNYGDPRRIRMGLSLSW